MGKQASKHVRALCVPCCNARILLVSGSIGFMKRRIVSFANSLGCWLACWRRTGRARSAAIRSPGLVNLLRISSSTRIIDSLPPATPAPAPDLPKIPSRLAPKPTKTMRSPRAPRSPRTPSLVTVDVAVVDNKNNFLPAIPRNHFRILEDNVPQTIKADSRWVRRP